MEKVLIANRGEIAVRIIRACQELGLKTVAVHSIADKDSLHTKIADESVCIGPAQSLKSYLNIPVIMSAAEITGADAIHPGYGFLSENAEFASVCKLHGIKFIGPTVENIKSLGNKVAARAIALANNVPMLPGSTGALTSEASALTLANEIGYPIIIKAAAGGGGRGMKIVRNKSELQSQWQLAQVEAQASFGDSACFMERYLDHPRHIEVQLVADQWGNYHHLGERDCTIQRRHQKLIEEAPASILTDAQRKEVGDHALKLAKAVGYQSLGTVEFLFQDNQFYFMEVNTRVQVEHPVTEIITGVDLVKTQIKIAMGEKFITLAKNQGFGHAIECRINAEDPETFAPWPGRVTDYHTPGGPGVRIDSMLYAGYTVPSHYDSLIAKLITFGTDREEAIIRMRRALKELKIEGIRTNSSFHQRLMNDKGFCENQISTHYLQTFLGK